MSGHMHMTAGKQPANIPWPQHSFSMAVESYVKRSGGLQKWEVHFFAPGLAVWKLPMPWVRLPSFITVLPPATLHDGLLSSSVSALCRWSW